MKKSRKKLYMEWVPVFNAFNPVTRRRIMKTWLVLCISLSVSLWACNKKKDEKPAETKPVQAQPVKPAEPALVEAQGVKPEDEKVECTSNSCTVSVITKAVKAEIEKKKDYEQLTIVFRKETGNEFFKTAANLPWLRSLDISGTSVDTLAPLEKLVKLEELRASSLKWDDKDREKRLDISALKGHPNLKKLDFYGTKVSHWEALADSTALVELSFYMSEVENIDFARKLTNLEVFDLYACPVKDLSPLEGLTKLRKLNLYMGKAEDFSVLAKLVNLEEIWLQFTAFSDLNLLSGATKMKTLYLSWLKGQLTDISAVKNFPELDSFSASDTPIEKIDALAECKKLRNLQLSGTKIKDIKALSGLTQLASVDLAKTEVKDIAPLAKAAELWSLNISGTKVKSLAPLKDLTKLSSITVSKGFPKGEIEKLKKNNPKLQVSER